MSKQEREREIMGKHCKYYIVIWVQDTGDILCQISVQHSLDVTTNINCSIKKRKQNKCQLMTAEWGQVTCLALLCCLAK